MSQLLQRFSLDEKLLEMAESGGRTAQTDAIPTLKKELMKKGYEVYVSNKISPYGLPSDIILGVRVNTKNFHNLKTDFSELAVRFSLPYTSAEFYVLQNPNAPAGI